MSPTSGYATTDDGVRLYFQSIGSGPRTLLIPNGIPLIGAFQYFAKRRRMIFFDARNRGQSDLVTDESKLQRGIHNDVDDLDAVQRHVGATQVDLIGHSYMGLAVILYAMKYSANVNRIIQIGAVPPHATKEYSPELTAADGVLAEVLSQLAELRKAPPSADPGEVCRQFWSVLAPIYVVDPTDVGKLEGWQRCHLPNERNALKYFQERLLPSYQTLSLTESQLSAVTMPVLTVHGRKDRSAPFGGAADWARMLPNARLLLVADAGHMPWIEAPQKVLGAIATFLDGDWPETA